MDTQKLNDILENFHPNHISQKLDAELRGKFRIRL